MANPIIYCWDEDTKVFSYTMESQLDPLETEKAGRKVYSGLPANGTRMKPLEDKEGFQIIWNGFDWEYQEIKKEESEEYEKTELDIAKEEYLKAQMALSATDYRTLKYIDGEYTEEEYEQYKQERSVLRQAVREAEAKIKELEEK